jgi:hypothetical protein
MILVPVISDLFFKQYNLETSIVWSVDKMDPVLGPVEMLAPK